MKFALRLVSGSSRRLHVGGKLIVGLVTVAAVTGCDRQGEPKNESQPADAAVVAEAQVDEVAASADHVGAIVAMESVEPSRQDSSLQPPNAGAPSTLGPLALSSPLDPSGMMEAGEQPRDSMAGTVSLARPTDATALREEANALVQDLVKAFPGSPDALEVKARFHLLVGETAEARACWEQAIALAADYGYAMHGLGKVAMLEGDHELAVSRFSNAAEKLPDLAELAHDRSKAHTKLGQLSEAITVLKTYVGQHPDSTETWVLLGQAYQADRQFEPAKLAYETALEQIPDLPRAQQGLGTVLVRLGDRERAKELLEAQREARKDSLTNRSADEVFADELRDYSSRFVFAARVFLAGNQFDSAERALLRATVFDPANTDAWTALIGLCQQTNRQGRAIEHALRMCESNPNNASCFFTLAVLQTQSGQIDAARQAFQSVVELAPNSPAGYDSLVRLNIQTQTDLQQCISLAKELIEVRGAAADHELLAQAYVVNGNLPAAQTSLEKALELDPSNQAYQAAMKQLSEFQRLQSSRDADANDN